MRLIPEELKTSFKNKDISFPTNYHPFQLKYFSQVSTLSQNLRSLHIAKPSPNLAHLTSQQVSTIW